MDTFEGLADPVRRALLSRLSAAPTRVVDLAAEQSISRPGVSKHLRVLSELGLVRVEISGRERHYRLDTEPLAAVRAFLDTLERPSAESAPDLRTSARSGPAARMTAGRLAALDTEVRRTSRQRGAAACREPEAVAPTPTKESA